MVRINVREASPGWYKGNNMVLFPLKGAETMVEIGRDFFTANDEEDEEAEPEQPSK